MGENECWILKASTDSFITLLVKDEPGSVTNLLKGKLDIYWVKVSSTAFDEHVLIGYN